MRPGESQQQARAVFAKHVEGCAQCARYNGESATLNLLCLTGVKHLKEATKPLRFAGDKAPR